MTTAPPDEANAEALRRTSDGDGPGSEGMAEAYWVALLDLTDAALHAGDPDGAAGWLTRLDPLERWTGTMATHQRHRLGVLRARHALATGDTAGAAEHARAVADDARAHGAGRYAAVAGVVAWAAGAAPDPTAAEALLDAVERVAGAESWWLFASVAEQTGSAALRSRAADRAAAAIGSAGSYAGTLERWVARVMG